MCSTEFQVILEIKNTSNCSENMYQVDQHLLLIITAVPALY